MTPRVVGPVPALPGAVGRLIAAPVPAERIAALRIGVGLVLVFDVAVMYLPFAGTFYGPDGTGVVGPEPPGAAWSVLRWLPTGGYVLLGVWLAAAVALVVGWRPRTAALVAWAAAVSVLYGDLGMHNGGDRLRSLLLLTLIFTPSGAVWSVRPVRSGGPVWVSGWPARLMLVQLCCLYAFSGWAKFVQPGWRDGTTLRAYCQDPQWCAASAWLSGVPPEVFLVASWVTLGWELGFPALAVLPRVRAVALALGVVFHLGTAATLEVALFPIYALCCYLPLVPWERWRRSTPGGGPDGGQQVILLPGEHRPQVE